MIELRALTPVDVLHLHGNQIFGESGSFGASMMPPWPSVVAGALRARMLVDSGVSFAAFREGKGTDERVGRVLGLSPQEPGTFRVRQLCLLREQPRRELLFPLPADLVCTAAPREGAPGVQRLVPSARAPAWVQSGCDDLPEQLVLRSSRREKPRAGVWFTDRALKAYLGGDGAAAEAIVQQGELWARDTRAGIALDAGSRTVEEGRLYSSECIAFCAGVSLLVGVSGAETLLPGQGLLRLGGEGRGAAIARWEPGPGLALPWEHLPTTDRFAVVLATPGLFPGGWLLPGVERADRGFELRCGDLTARLCAAAVPRAEPISGWDIAEHRPKPALRAVPTGAVYGFERVSGSLGSLKLLLEDGLWPLFGAALEGEEGRPWRQRRAEGFNNVWLANWLPANG